MWLSGGIALSEQQIQYEAQSVLESLNPESSGGG
jgi:hypothetical protein